MRRISVSSTQDQDPQMLPLPDVMSNVQVEAEFKRNDKKVDLDLENVLKPYLWSLRVAGVYYLDGKGGVLSGYTSFSFMYCILVSIIMLLHTGHKFLIIPRLKTLDDLMSAGIPLVWTIYNLLIFICMIHYCAKKKGWRALFVEYRSLLECPCGPDKVPFKRRCWKYVIVTWVVTLINVFFTIYMSFWTSSMDMMALPFDANTPAGRNMKVAVTVGHTYTAILFCFSVLHTVIMADLLGTIFKEYNTKFRQYTTECYHRITHIVMFMKEFHQGLSRLVESADSLVSALMGVQVVFNLMLTCAVAYMMIYNPFRIYTTIFYMLMVFWLIICLGAIFVTSAIAAWLNIQAHEAFEVLQDIKLRQVTEDLTLQMTLFVTKLNGTQIGFTVGNMFCLDKSAILSFIGVLLTYFFLLLQFRPSMIPPVCDCTSALSNLTLQCTT